MSEYITKFLPINERSRPGKKLRQVRGIVNHYTASAGGRAKGVYNYFSQGHDASAHAVIDLNGDIWQLIGFDEVAYHVGASSGYKYTDLAVERFGGAPNQYTIGIEWCHSDASGKPTPETYASAVRLNADLCKQFGLTAEDIYLHNDMTGKWCHKYFCDNPSEWSQFKADVASLLNPVDEAQRIADALAAKGWSSSPDYWAKAMRGEQPVNPEYLKALLKKAAGI